MRTAALVAALTVVACWACGSANARFFGPDSPWNTPLAPNAKLTADSAGMAQDLVRQVATYGPWINSTEFSVPIYTVPADQPGVPVYVDNNNDMYTNDEDALALTRQLDGVPIPPGARPAAGTDNHMVIWQPSTDTMWELWLARNPDDGGYVWWRDNSPGWHVAWGARIDHVSTASGVNPAPFGATASGLALAGGLITNEDLQRGYIDHAVAIAIPGPMLGKFVAPATRTDGKYAGPDAIPEGTRFRLPADLDVASLNLTPVTRMIAEAAQRYGIIVRDYAGAVAFYAEDPTPSGNDILLQRLNGQSPGEALASFPWDRLQVVDPEQSADSTVPPSSGSDAPPVTQPSGSPPPSGALRPQLRAAAAPTQRISTVLRSGIRVTCSYTSGETCSAKLTIGGLTAASAAGPLRSAQATVMTARLTRFGRTLLRNARRRTATLAVRTATAGPIKSKITFVR